MLRNVSDKVINEQGNVATFCAGSDARLMYQNNDGELKKYLIEGEGGGGGTDTPSALFDPELEYNYIDTSYEDYTHTVTIGTKRLSSDNSILKYIDNVEGNNVNVISINSTDTGRNLSLTNINGITINCDEYYIKNGNNYRFQSLHYTKIDESQAAEFLADEFELNGRGINSDAKIYTDMGFNKGKFEIIFGVNTGVSDVTKREFILRFINDGVNENLDFKIVARVTKVEDEQETVNETAVFTASIMDDGSIVNS